LLDRDPKADFVGRRGDGAAHQAGGLIRQFPHQNPRKVSFPKIPSGKDSHHEAESSHHFDR
jgi:hypothetical protein